MSESCHHGNSIYNCPKCNDNVGSRDREITSLRTQLEAANADNARWKSAVEKQEARCQSLKSHAVDLNIQLTAERSKVKRLVDCIKNLRDDLKYAQAFLPNDQSWEGWIGMRERMTNALLTELEVSNETLGEE